MYVPNLPPCTRVDREEIIGQREIQNPIHLQRCRGKRRRAVRLKRPRQSERTNVGLIDLRKGAVAAAGIIAVIVRPRIRARVYELWWIEFLRR